MSIFSSDYSKPGPGVRPDEPRKKGPARLWEVVSRDVGSFFKAGFLALVSALPFLLGMAVAIGTHTILFMILAGVLGGLLAAPQLCGLADTILRSLRDEPGYWWVTYHRAWRRNAKATIFPGAVFGLIIGMELFTLFHMDGLGSTLTDWVILIAGLLLSTGLGLYFFQLLALLDMPMGTLLKNAALMFIGFLPRSLAAAAVQLIYWGAMIWYLSVAVYILPFTNFWLPMCISWMILYPVVEKSFGIEEAIHRKQDAELKNWREQHSD